MPQHAPLPTRTAQPAARHAPLPTGTGFQPTEPDPEPSDHQALGWPVDAEGLVIGDQVGALLMPAELGARVQQVLSIHILAGPVIAYPDRWAVLTEPGGHDRTGALSRGPVVAARAGQRLPLPPSADARWVGGLSQPPAWQTVVSATRRAIETPQFAGM